MGREFLESVVGSSQILLLLDSVQAALKRPSKDPVWESLSLVIHIGHRGGSQVVRFLRGG